MKKYYYLIHMAGDDLKKKIVTECWKIFMVKSLAGTPIEFRIDIMYFWVTWNSLPRCIVKRDIAGNIGTLLDIQNQQISYTDNSQSHVRGICTLSCDAYHI